MATEVKIRDMFNIVDHMGPIKIIIDDEVAWEDNVDLTKLTDAEAEDAQYDNFDKFYKTITRDDPISSINFDIVQGHHSIVSFKTLKKSD